MSEWMTLRVVLVGRGDTTLSSPPGRIVLAHADHTFADLADAVDPAFGRWDLVPDHRFTVDRQLIASGGGFSRDEADDSDDVTLGEVALRPGQRFRYTFDADERWEHTVEILDEDADIDDLVGEEPDAPVCVDGWGWLPDQYGREDEDDDTGWDDDLEERAASWTVVDAALDHRPREPEPHAVAEAVAALRTDASSRPARLLWAAAGLEPEAAPDDAVAAWLVLAMAVLDPVEPRDSADAEDLAALAAVDPADWAGAVIELVRTGVGTSAEPRALCQRIAVCPEIEGEELSADDAAVVERGVRVVVPMWQALAALDDQQRLTRLGAWGLPEALRLAWSSASDPALPETQPAP